MPRHPRKGRTRSAPAWLRTLALAAAALLASPTALAAAPSAGVAQKIRQGFFIETDVGVFFTVGGEPRGYSNGQAYIQLGIGYDVLQQLSLGLSFALGASASSCFNRGGLCGPPGFASDNFTMSFYELTVAYDVIRLIERLDLGIKFLGGYATMDPTPKEDPGATPGSAASGFSAGFGIGAEYATNLDHFAIGIQATGRYVLPANIPAIAIFARVKYTF